MEKGVLKIVFAVLFLLPVCTNATTMDFYTDGTIVDGNVFDTVNIWNTATVDMTGGIIQHYVFTYDHSTMNIYGGSVENFADIGVIGNSTLNLYRLELPAILPPTSNHRIWTEGDNAKIHVYGYDFQYVQASSDWLLYGKWADDTEFGMRLRGPFTRPNVVLHEIPEPVTFMLLGLGYFFIKIRS